MKRIFAILALLFQSTLSFCQNSASELLEIIHSKRVTMTYSFKSGKVTLGSGTVVINGDWYLSKSKGLDVYCDGESRWMVDSFAKEVYIEKAGGTGDYITSMDRILSHVRDLKLNSASASGIFTDTSTGEDVTFNFSDMKKTELEDEVSEFRFSVDVLDPSWVVTDLRD